MFKTIAMDFAGGGDLMYPVVALGLAVWSGLVATVVAQLFSKSPRATLILARIVGALALATVAFGLFASVSSFRTALEAIAHVRPDDAGIIAVAAGTEALILVQYALGLVILPAAAAWLIAGIASSPRAATKAA